jgi:protein-L-isoaspartate(D-aspartate) O-methyltransferase
VAFQTMLLHLNKGDKVLEIGTGSGYQTAVLCETGAEVYSVERNRKLYLKARKNLSGLGYHPHLFFGDGYEGLPEYAPFDKILITAGTEQIPQELLKQLVVGGRMVLPLGNIYRQEMTVVERIDNADFHISEHGSFIFVPMLKGIVE